MRRLSLEENRLEAEYSTAFSLGLVPSPQLSEAERRRTIRNSNKASYGTRYFSSEAFFLHEIITFRLLYAEEASSVRHKYRMIDDAEIESYYRNNHDLFTRYKGDSFPLDEIRDVIKKKIREDEYEELVRQNLLHQQH